MTTTLRSKLAICTQELSKTWTKYWATIDLSPLLNQEQKSMLEEELHRIRGVQTLISTSKVIGCTRLSKVN